MTLTDLATHICTQCGMTDTDDLAAAQMFLQRRLEMIWNAELWRDSLLEATLTINPNDTTTLADSYWISERSVLLLPAAMERIMAVRVNTNSLEAASLESYYRTDTDWLNYTGTPFEFQVLKPVIMEWVTPQTVKVTDTNATDTGASTPISCNYSNSPDGVTINSGTIGVNGTIGSALQLLSFSKPVTAGTVTLQLSTPLSVSGITYTGSPQPTATITVIQGHAYTITPGANENGVLLVNGMQTMTLTTGTPVTVTAQGSTLLFEYPNLLPSNVSYATGVYLFNVPNTGVAYNYLFGANDSSLAYSPGGFNSGTTGQVLNFTPSLVGITLGSGGAFLNSPVTGQLFVAATGLALTASIIDGFAVLASASNLPPIHQRIRLTEAPTTSQNLRVLGKGKCPILGPYDTPPIINVEPTLMAFARSDMLFRQRQAGKAALAQQEGETLLKALIEAEAFHQAGEFRIQPDGGFGQDNFWMQTTPDSWHPI